MADPKIRVNWTIPVPIIAAILLQAVILGLVIGVWKTTIEKNLEQAKQETDAQFRIVDSRIGMIEKSIASNALISERVKGVEVNIDVLKEQTVRIERKLDSALERRR